MNDLMYKFAEIPEDSSTFFAGFSGVKNSID